MAVASGSVTSRPPAAEDLLARWRECFRSADFEALSELYHQEAFLSGGRVTPSIGREEIRGYFDAIEPTEDADVRFTEVQSRLIAPTALVVLTRAEFIANGVSLPTRLTQVWMEDWAEWVIACHQVTPLAALRPP